MKKLLCILSLIPVLSVSADQVLDIHKINWHSPDKTARIERITDDGSPAIRFTAPVFSQLRMPIHPVADWSKYARLEFKYKIDRTMGVGFGYLYSKTNPKEWGTRLEYDFNKAVGQGRMLPGNRWLTGRIKLTPSEKFNPEQIIMLSFGVTDRHAKIDRKTPVAFEMKEFKLIEKSADKVPGDPKRAAAYDAFLKTFKPDLSPIVPAELPKKGLIVVKDGKPAAEIILGENELPKSAEELQRWIKEITGATLPVLKSPSSTMNTKIFLGRAFASAQFASDIEKLGQSDGCAMRKTGNHVHLFGAIPKGTMNAVFRFIERNSDLIWPRPDPEMAAVFTKTPDFYAANCDEVSRPATLRRGWGTNGGLNIHDEIWNSRNLCNAPAGGGGYDPGNDSRIPWDNFLTYGGGHNLYLFLPGKTYFARHPEYYALINGKRQEPKAMENNPCFTHPAMLDAFTASVLAELRKKPLPPNSSLGIQIEDNWGLCECARCLEPITLPDGKKLTIEAPNFRSTQFYIWMNELAGRILKEFPDLKFHTYAYFFTAPAPAVKINPAVGAKFCPYIRPNDKYPMYSAVNGEWFDRIAAWSKVCPRVILREYYGVGMAFPRPLSEMVACDLRSVVPMGILELTSEIAPDRDRNYWEKKRGSNPKYKEVWDASHHDFWVITRLWWNPDQDVEQLRRYFFQRAYRKAAMPMARYYAKLRSAWYQDKLPSTCGDGAVNLFKHYIINKNLEDSMRRDLIEAEKLADHQVSKKLVQRHRARFEEWAEEAHSIKTPSAAVPLLTSPDFSKGVTLTDFSPMGNPKQKSALTTSAQLFHDAKNLHIRVTATGDPSGFEATASKTKEERWTSGDHIELFLTDGQDPNRYYQFVVDCLGNRCDLDNFARMKWNGNWKSTARKTATGYEVDLAIPFETIRFSLGKPDVKMLLMREMRNPKGYSSWGGGKVHQMGEFGDLKLMR